MTCSQQLLDQLLSQNKTLLSSQGKDVGPRQENLPLRQPQTFLPSQKLILSEREQSFSPDVGQFSLTSMGINYYPNSHLSHIPSQEQNSFHSQQQSFLPSKEQSFLPSQELSFPTSQEQSFLLTSQGLTADHFLSGQTASHKSPFLLKQTAPQSNTIPIISKSFFPLQHRPTFKFRSTAPHHNLPSLTGRTGGPEPNSTASSSHFIHRQQGSSCSTID